MTGIRAPISAPPVDCTLVVDLQSDFSAIEHALAELFEFSAEVSDHFAHLGFGFGEAFEKLFRLRLDRAAAAGANVVRVVAEPTEALRLLLVAGRAGNLDRLTFEQILGHEFISVGSVGTSNVAGAPDATPVASGEPHIFAGGPSMTHPRAPMPSWCPKGQQIILAVMRERYIGAESFFGPRREPQMTAARRIAIARLAAAGFDARSIARLMRRNYSTIRYWLRPKFHDYRKAHERRRTEAGCHRRSAAEVRA